MREIEGIDKVIEYLKPHQAEIEGKEGQLLTLDISFIIIRYQTLVSRKTTA